MDKYTCILKDKCRLELSLTCPHQDFLIKKYKDKKEIESFLIFDCRIDSYLPFIMRYCYEQKIDLENLREFLKSFKTLTCSGTFNISFSKVFFDIPLKSDENPIRLVNGNLDFYGSGIHKISFHQEDIPKFLEGTINVLENIKPLQSDAISIIHEYFKWFDKK